jgi:hypothetical protein
MNLKDSSQLCLNFLLVGLKPRQRNRIKFKSEFITRVRFLRAIRVEFWAEDSSKSRNSTGLSLSRKASINMVKRKIKMGYAVQIL